MFDLGIGMRIASIRREARITQEQLAEAADLGVGTIKKIETGQQGVKAHQVVRLAEALGVSCDYILTGNTPGHMIAAQELGLSALTIDELRKLNKDYSLTLRLVEYLIANHRDLSEAIKSIERAIVLQKYRNRNRNSDVSFQNDVPISIDDVINSLTILANDTMYYQISGFIREEADRIAAKEDNP